MTRRSPQNPEMIAGALKLLPARWAIAILVAAIAYVVLQPKLNQWFGWNLPSAAAMLGQEAPAAKSKQPPITKPDTAANGTDATSSKTSSGSKTSSNDSADLKFRFLKPLGRDRYESPAGLIYTPGSEEGHRLKHIERHVSDQPNRPGSHGVFDGDMESFLTAIDDGYKRARGHAKGTKQREEEGMTVFEAPFDKPIGYLGGSEGARKGKPKLKRLRIVVRDKNLITAFPIQ